ncbi:Putative metabolite transport protein YwtG [Planktothrix tepida]|uniref:Putative metabolite transport protein YwtG n=1 Tax=Planktothrix tepida PCC 9214 TaxID=671072 RepID=A0A1J1LI18_9CYAN|nr:sugar porter family MFS transporter [Planktothrix tepida]CAD5983767.1 Putative metabolite transport protein YwtG [Planktothrix tepida]CUR32253.1 putative metabolite transport protein YwtG [Planktothrix tepida PCC 9214]
MAQTSSTSQPVPSGTHHQVSRFVIIVSAIAAIGGLLFGYDTGVISGAILFIKEQFRLDSTMQEFVVSSVLVGSVTGAALGGLLGDRFGRRHMIILAGIIFGLGALLTAFTPNLTILVIGRVIVGVGIGIASFISPMYISEVAPKSIRGTLVFLNQLALTLGILLSYWVDYLFTNVSEGWRLMLGLAIVPALALALGMAKMPDSPRWLIMRNRGGQARKVLHQIRGTQNVDAELEEIHSSLATEGSSQWSDLLKPALRLPLMIGIGLAIFQQVTGINTVIYYAPTIMEFSGLKSAGASILATTGVGVINVLFTIVGSWFVDRAGRRPLLLTSLIGMAISLALLAVSFQLPQLASSLGVAVVIILMLYVASFAIGLGPVFWLLISEIYPLNIRSKAMSVATVANWGANLIVAMTFLSIVNALGRPGAFWLYAVLTLCSVVFTYLLVPETKGRTLEQIQEELKTHHLK